MCHILPNVPKLPDTNVTYITEYAIHILQNMPKLLHDAIVTVNNSFNA